MTIVRAAQADMEAALAAASTVARDMEDLGTGGGHFRRAKWDDDTGCMSIDGAGPKT